MREFSIAQIILRAINFKSRHVLVHFVKSFSDEPFRLMVKIPILMINGNAEKISTFNVGEKEF